MSIPYEEEEIFFDSWDYIQAPPSPPVPSEDLNTNENVNFEDLQYEMWANELGSISERRRRFLHKTGLTDLRRPSRYGCSEEILDLNNNTILHCSDEPMFHGMERVTASTETTSSSWIGGNDDLKQSNKSGSRSSPETAMEAPTQSDQDCPKTHKHCYSKEKTECCSSTTSDYEGKINGISGESNRKKWKSLWRLLGSRNRENEACSCGGTVLNPQITKPRRVRVKRHKKTFMEFSGLYMGQEIQAHKGFIQTMKFSPDGEYLATGGEDGVVRVWHITEEALFALKSLKSPDNNFMPLEKSINAGRRNATIHSAFVIPEKMFKIEEVPAQELHGHTGTILDLSWSSSNCLLSSSEDKTVRLWQVGRHECLQVFHHQDYVTCIQFNPVDERYFISGSIDGKVRVWGVLEKRVVDWVDVRDIVTAVCYQPDGKGIIAGSITGHCRFYTASGNLLELEAQLCFQGEKNSTSKRITGLQFTHEDRPKLMVTSADSRMRILDGLTVICKYKDIRNSGNQTSASITQSGEHIISVGKDSHIYMWNYNHSSVASSKRTRSVQSCEFFLSEGVSVAIPWTGKKAEESITSSATRLGHQMDGFRSFSSDGCFRFDKTMKNFATWPEEKLPVSVIMSEEEQRFQGYAAGGTVLGQVIVTGGWDGVIRCFQNYGFPVRL